MLTDEQRHAIVQERLAGAGIVSLMRKYRLAHPKLRRILAEAGAMPESAKAVAGRPPAPFGCGSYYRDIEARSGRARRGYGRRLCRGKSGRRRRSAGGGLRAARGACS